MICFAGMLKGETEGDEATRAVVEAAKAVAGGNLLCSLHCKHRMGETNVLSSERVGQTRSLRWLN